MKQSLLFAVLVMVLSTLVANAQISTFPYSYSWSGATSIHGDGNYDTTTTGTNVVPFNAISYYSGPFGGTSYYAQTNQFTNGTSSLIMSLNTAGRIFDGSEMFSFVIYPKLADQWGGRGSAATFRILCQANGQESTLYSIRTDTVYGAKTVVTSLPQFLGNDANAKILFQVVNTTGSVNQNFWLTTFSLFGGALPVQLSSFSATAITSQAVTLTWTTISEINNYGFYVQRDGIDLPGAFVPGHGTTLQRQSYVFTDKSPLPGKHNYRVKQVDLDRTATLSEAVVVDVPVAFALYQNYPNPFNPSTTIHYGLSQKSDVQLKVYTTLGQEVVTLIQEEQETGYHEVLFDGAGLASGVYLYRIQAGSFVQTKKLLLVR